MAVSTKTAARSSSSAKARWGQLTLAIPLMSALLLASMVVSTYLGAAELSIGQVWNAILGKLPFVHVYAQPISDPIKDIVWQLRMPRVVLAALVGAMLALAGGAFQGLLRNPLADPYIVGVSSGAAVGGAIAMLLNLSALFYGFGVPAIAFAFAMLGMMLVYAIARRSGYIQVSAFLLAGVAIGSALWSLITLILIAARQDLNSILYWLMGSFADRTWSHVLIAAPFAVIGWLMLQWQAYALNVFTLGEETAAHLGIEVERLKNIVLIAGALITAAAVSACGIVGFVGLIVPHLSRRMFGADYRLLYPTAALMGAILMVWADVIARMALRPTEIPVGVITALIGTPFFIYLLKRTSS